MTSTSSATLNGTQNQAIANDAATQENVQGRSVFQIQTVAAGVMVSTAFLTSENQLLQLPAVFPSLEYALEQLDELRRHVLNHFAQAAQVGAQVIAANAVAATKEAVTQNNTHEEEHQSVEPDAVG